MVDMLFSFSFLPYEEDSQVTALLYGNIGGFINLLHFIFVPMGDMLFSFSFLPYEEDSQVTALLYGNIGGFINLLIPYPW